MYFLFIHLFVIFFFLNKNRENVKALLFFCYVFSLYNLITYNPNIGLIRSFIDILGF